jgi:hypothetical protein
LQKHQSKHFTFLFFKQKLNLKSIYIFGHSCSSCHTEHSKIGFAIFGFFYNFQSILQGAGVVYKTGKNLFALGTLKLLKNLQIYLRFIHLGPDGGNRLAGGEVGLGHANKQGGSSIRLTCDRLVAVDRPVRTPASGSGGAAAARPREARRR